MTLKSSEHYLIEAAEAAEQARVQTHNPDAMRAHVERGQLLLSLHSYVAEREAAGLTIPAEEAPIAVTDAHGLTWVRRIAGAGFICVTAGHSLCGQTFATYEALAAAYGPLKPAEERR